MIFANLKLSKLLLLVKNSNKKFELAGFLQTRSEPERKKTFWSENAIKSLDSLGFSELGRVIRKKDLFLGLNTWIRLWPALLR